MERAKIIPPSGTCTWKPFRSPWSHVHTVLILLFALCPARPHGQGRASNLVRSVDTPHISSQSNSLFRSSIDRPSILEHKLEQQSNIRYFHSDQRCIEDIFSSGFNEIASVNTKYGKLTGRISYLCDLPGHTEPPLGWRAKVVANVTLFLGVPYAKAPTKKNNLRFRSPLPPDFWGSIDASQYKPACLQPIEFTGPHRMIDKVDEDCLYMNIFSPSVAATSSLFPVMVYIHDGDFEHGSGNTFPGHMLSASQQVIVVTFNYRLGLLGYFSTGDNSSAGNYGLLDQMQALHFIRENIKHFNGDASEITVFGSGSGAVSATLLALSPLSSKLVKRVIASSGSPLADWALLRNSQAIGNLSAEAALAYGCRSDWNSDRQRIVDCLSARSHGDILSTQSRHNFDSLSWAPVLDSGLRDISLQTLPHPPEVLVRLQSQSTWKNNNFAFMTGFNRDDGSPRLFADPVFVQRNNFADQSYFDHVIKSFVSLYTSRDGTKNSPLKSESLRNAITFLYSPCWGEGCHDGNEHFSSALISSIVDMFTDSWYLSPAYSLVHQLVQEEVPTYMYRLNHPIECLRLPHRQSVPHHLEYFLLSGGPFLPSSFYPSLFNLQGCKWSPSDRNISRFIMQAWTNFAKLGNPTPVPAFGSIVWKPVSKVDPLWHLVINDTSFHQSTRMDSHYRLKYAQFWSDYIKVILKQEPLVQPFHFESTQLQIRLYSSLFWALVVLSVLLLLITLLCSCLVCSHSRNSKERHNQYIEKGEKVDQSTVTATGALANERRISPTEVSAPNKFYAKEEGGENCDYSLPMKRPSSKCPAIDPIDPCGDWDKGSPPFTTDSSCTNWPQRSSVSLQKAPRDEHRPSSLQKSARVYTQTKERTRGADSPLLSLNAGHLDELSAPVCRLNSTNESQDATKSCRKMDWHRKNVCNSVSFTQSSDVQVKKDITPRKGQNQLHQMSGRKSVSARKKLSSSRLSRGVEHPGRVKQLENSIKRSRV